MVQAQLVTGLASQSFAGLFARLDQGLSAGIQVLGDSTGTTRTGWVDLLARDLSSRYPGHAVAMRTWNDATQAYDADQAITAGPGGGRYWAFGSGTDRGGYLPDAQIALNTSSFDIRVLADFTEWPVPTQQTLAGMWNSAVSAQQTFRFRVETSGVIAAQIIFAGALGGFHGSSAITHVPGVPQWYRLTFLGDNGAGQYRVNFYTSPDGVTWTARSGVTGVIGPQVLQHAGSRNWEVGAYDIGVSLASVARIYKVQVLDAIDGQNLAPELIDAWWPYVTAGVPASRGGSPTLLVVNGSKGGATMDYLTDVTRLPKMTPIASQAVTFLSCSHNDLGENGPAYLAKWDTWLTTLRARLPEAQFVVLTQNPRAAPIVAASIASHAARRGQLISWAQRNGLGYVDTYQSFLDSAAGLPALINTDGIHPNVDGSALWAAAVRRAMGLG